MASENSVGTIPSEAFTVLGEGTTCQYPPCPQCVQNDPQFNFEILHNFTASEQSPAAGLSFDRAGRVYGTTGSGGVDGLGLAYQLAQFEQNWILNPLYSFLGGSSGQNPSPGIIGPDGAVYGTAAGGGDICQGNQPCGEVYRLNPGPTACLTALCGWGETVLYRFNAPGDGFQPNGNLLFDRSGNLYGTTISGGLYGLGTVYELTPSNGSWTETVLYNFNPATDYGSPTTLLLGQDGNLYGTTGWEFPTGVIFQLVSSGGTWTENILSTAGGCNGTNGTCNLRLYGESQGSFFGAEFYEEQICRQWCVTALFARIFQMSPSPGGWQFSTLADTSSLCQNQDICNDPGAYDVFYGLAVDPAGHVYGTEGYGEQDYFSGGDIFRVLQPGQRGGLEGFVGDNFRDIELRADGKLYGTTGTCGNSMGTVWQLTPPPPEPKFTVLYNFTGGVDGAAPGGGLTMDAAGSLYGTAAGGGSNNCTNGCGTVFKLSKQTSSWSFEPLYDFTGAPNGDGGNPEARVTFGSNGVLYGTTQAGGTGQCSGGCGTVFSLQSESGRSRAGAGPWTETVIHEFQGARDGRYPWGQIAIDQAGNIYGVTLEGGLQGSGTAYQLAPALGGWTLNLLHTFTGGADGGDPYGGVVLDSSGNVYGSAQYGGGASGCGLVFQLAPSGGGWTENVVYDFPGSPACSPEGDLLRDNAGNLYGITGPVFPGVAYMLSSSGQNWNYSQIYSFGPGPGTQPGSLTMDAAGNLYGTSCLGGASQAGSVFELSPGPGGWTFIPLHDFNNTEGRCPRGTVLVDANGSLYGTASGGGAHNDGVVWQIVR